MNAVISPLSKARSDAPRSVFRPPVTMLRSVPPPKKSLTAAATPWSPPKDGTHQHHHQQLHSKLTGPPKPPAPLHSTPPLNAVDAPSSSPSHVTGMGGTARAPPAALGQSPGVRPVVVAALSPDELTLPAASTGAAALNNPLSVSFTPISDQQSIFTEEAVATGVYTVDMLHALRKDAGHTPRRILAWILDLYRATPVLRVPPHLLLAVEEPGIDDALLERGFALGSSLKYVKRSRPVRQIQHKVMSILSRVTPQKYQELQKELMELPLKQTDDNELKEVVRVFFEKAVQEQTFSSLYANLVADVCRVTDAEKELEKEVRDKLLAYRMRRELLSTCQEEFQRPLQLSEDDKVDPLTGKPLEAEEVEFKRDRLKRRLCGNIKFVGELYKQRLVTDRVIGQVLRILVGDYDESNPTKKETYVFEVFATLLKTAGVQCQQTYPEILNEMMGHAKRVEKSHPVARVRFQMMDLGDLSKKGWEMSKRDKLMTTEERERELLDEQRRQIEEVEKLARQRQQQQASDQALMARSGGAHLSKSSPTVPFAHHHFGPSATSSPLTPKMGFSERNQQSAPPPPPPHQTSGNATPAASPAKRLSSSAGNIAASSPSASSTTPPPRYQQQQQMGRMFPGASSQHAAGGGSVGNIPHALSGSALNEHSMPRTTSTASSIGSPMRAASTPLTPAAPPALHIFAEQLMAILLSTKNTQEVLMRLATLGVKHRVHVLTFWLRRVTTNTKLFSEREQIGCLFSAILAAGDSILSGTDLCTTFLEWIRYDLETNQHETCPRMFANLAFVVQQANSPKLDPAGLSRAILHCGAFNVMLRELVANDQLPVATTLVKEAYPVANAIVSQIADAPTSKGNVLLAAENRFRLLPFLLSSQSASNGAAGSSTASCPGASGGEPRTPTSAPTNFSGSESSLLAHYDPLSQCTANPRTGDEGELLLFRKFKEAETSAQWRDAAMQQMLSTFAGAPSNHVGRLVQMMKAIGAFAACLYPRDVTVATAASENGGSFDGSFSALPLFSCLTEQDFDDVVKISRQRFYSASSGTSHSEQEVDACIIAELLMHFTFTTDRISTPVVSTAASDSPTRHREARDSMLFATHAAAEGRLAHLGSILARWDERGVMPVQSALALFATVVEPSGVSCSPLGGSPHGLATPIVGTPHNASVEDIAAQHSTETPPPAATGPTASSSQQGNESSGGDLYTIYHNFIVDYPWSMAIQLLSHQNAISTTQ